MAPFKEYRVGREGTAYLRLDLSYGLTLFRLALNKEIDQGVIAAYLPERFAHANLGNFDVGGVWECYEPMDDAHADDDWNESQRYIGEVCASFLAAHRDACILFEDYVHDASIDPPKNVRYVSYKREVYLLLQHHDCGNLPLILDIIFNKASLHCRRGMLTSCNALEGIVQHQSASLEVLETTALAASHIIVGAYDEEAELIWSKKGVRFGLGDFIGDTYMN
jgi:hypothetical protein